MIHPSELHSSLLSQRQVFSLCVYKCGCISSTAITKRHSEKVKWVDTHAKLSSENLLFLKLMLGNWNNFSHHTHPNPHTHGTLFCFLSQTFVSKPRTCTHTHTHTQVYFKSSQYSASVFLCLSHSPSRYKPFKHWQLIATQVKDSLFLFQSTARICRCTHLCCS